MSFKFRHIFEFVSCRILICLMSVAISLLWSDWFFMLLLSRSGCVSSSSELAARHGSLNLNMQRKRNAKRKKERKKTVWWDETRKIRMRWEKVMKAKWNYRRLSRPSSKSFCEELRFVSMFKLTAGGRLVKSEWWLGIAFVAVDGDDVKFAARKYGDDSKLFAYAKLLWFLSWCDGNVA